MNSDVEGWINGLAGHVGFIDTLMKLAANELIYLAIPLVLGLWFWPAEGPRRALNQRLAAGVVLGALLAMGLAAALGDLHTATRPFASDPGTKLLIRHEADNSFPSDHTAFAFAVAGAVVWRRRFVGGVALVFAALVGFARVYVGVHWPSDVLAGAAIGLGAGAVVALAVPLLREPQRWASRVFPSVLVARP